MVVVSTLLITMCRATNERSRYYEGCHKIVGLDVSKETISVGVADAGRGEPRFHGNIPNKPEAIRKLMKKLGAP